MSENFKDISMAKNKALIRAIAVIVIVGILAAIIWLGFALSKKAGELEQLRVQNAQNQAQMTVLSQSLEASGNEQISKDQWWNAYSPNSPYLILSAGIDYYNSGFRHGRAFSGRKKLISGYAVFVAGWGQGLKKDEGKQRVAFNLVLVCRAGCVVEDAPDVWLVKEFSNPINAHYNNYSTDQKFLDENLEFGKRMGKGGDNSYFTLHVGKAGEVINIRQKARELKEVPGAFTTWSKSLMPNYP